MKKGLLLIIACGALMFSSAYPSSLVISPSVVSSYLKGILYLAEGSYEEALKELEKVKKADPESGHLRLKIAFTLLKLGRREEAETEFKKAKTLEMDSLEASVALILLYASQKREKELESEYQYFLEKAHHLRPENIKVSEYLGQFYFYKKMPQEAIKIYEAIIEQQPDCVEGHFWLGYFYEETGKRETAIEMWKKTLQLNATHANALNSLGYLYAEAGENLDEAEGMIKKALEEDPNNGAYLDSLGWVYYKKAEYRKAEEYLLKALQHLKEAVIYEHAGDLYIQLEDKEKALQYYKEGLKLESHNEALKQKVATYEKQNTEAEKTSE